MEKRYDELIVGDVILWYGAKERITKIDVSQAPANEFYPDEVTVWFTLEPVDDEAVEILGKFYANGNYGGVGCLTVDIV